MKCLYVDMPPLLLQQFCFIGKATVGGLSVQDVCYCAVTKKLLICLSDSCDRSLLTSLQPDSADLLHSESSGRVKGVIITWKGPPAAQPGYDFFSRYFAPWNGIPEDPVTAFQCSGRGGELDLALRSDGRVDISGHAVIILQGTLML
ncbi:hypothetical protein AAFF_G00063410 [Aldrovandia affinis]|uniref:Phenazine biosynthesis-like protein n=1 Tax=Aldrovandia affinis TaxID=143900 RepID=A0AAD7WER1_9TELE|nr:hypothetical protein AAFF_G00063410 [Aldrovandia affinis]